MDQLELFSSVESLPIADPVADVVSAPYVEPPGPTCDRSPCSTYAWDPKASREEIEAARLVVGAPKLRRAMSSIAQVPIEGKFFVRGKRKGEQKTRPMPVWTDLDYPHRPGHGWPLAVAYGIGIDSTAILVGLVQLYRETRDERFRPVTITFADTGGEKLSTYAYLATINDWLARNGFPQVTTVAWDQGSEGVRAGSYGSHRTLEQKCMNNHTLPAITMSGFSSSECSITWKHNPQNYWFKHLSGLYVGTHVPNSASAVLDEIVRAAPNGLAVETVATRTQLSGATVRTHLTRLSEAGYVQWQRAGRSFVYYATDSGVQAHQDGTLMDVDKRLPGDVKIVKAIGYDATEVDRLGDAGTYRVTDDKDPDYMYWYPLMEWGWDRARCYAEIEAEIGQVPGKSSCFFCGAMKPEEIAALPRADLMRALLMEQVAMRGRHARGGDMAKVAGIAFAWSWTDFALGREEALPPRARGFGRLVEEVDVARIVALADEWIASTSVAKGTVNTSTLPLARRLPAFNDVRGVRTGQYGQHWDHYAETRQNPGLPHDPLISGSA